MQRAGWNEELSTTKQFPHKSNNNNNNNILVINTQITTILLVVLHYFSKLLLFLLFVLLLFLRFFVTSEGKKNDLRILEPVLGDRFKQIDFKTEDL